MGTNTPAQSPAISASPKFLTIASCLDSQSVKLIYLQFLLLFSFISFPEVMDLPQNYKLPYAKLGGMKAI